MSFSLYVGFLGTRSEHKTAENLYFSAVDIICHRMFSQHIDAQITSFGRILIEILIFQAKYGFFERNFMFFLLVNTPPRGDIMPPRISLPRQSGLLQFGPYPPVWKQQPGEHYLDLSPTFGWPGKSVPRPQRDFQRSTEACLKRKDFRGSLFIRKFSLRQLASPFFKRAAHGQKQFLKMPYIENRLTYILHEYVIFIPQVLPFQGMKANEEDTTHAPKG